MLLNLINEIDDHVWSLIFGAKEKYTALDIKQTGEEAAKLEMEMVYRFELCDPKRIVPMNFSTKFLSSERLPVMCFEPTINNPKDKLDHMHHMKQIQMEEWTV
ncbi:hypothetical protein Tco_0294208 [Tanacetum coccineum]